MFITAVYGTKGEMLRRTVSVDPDEGRVTFRRCHLPNRFLAWGVEDEYTCRLSELRGVFWTWMNGIGRILVILTPSGRASLPQTARGFDAVRAAILGGLSPTARPRWYQYPLVQTFIFVPLLFAVGFLATALLVDAPKWALILVAVLMLPSVAIPIATGIRGRPMW